jgi:hypothetical protein
MMRIAVALFLLTLAASAADLRVDKTDPIGRRIENAFYIADLSHRTINGRDEDSGTLRALTLKDFGVTLFRDPSNGRMHKGPSFQRAGARSYKDIGSWTPVQSFREEQKGGTYIHHREGYFADYPEVKIEVEYRFFADAPYFIVADSMTVEKPLKAALVRNNEMTMNLFFTHLAWPGRDGAVRIVSLDERKPILEKEPIPADVPWLAFVNLDKCYGYGFVMLESEASKTANADTTISDGVRSGTTTLSGRYWSRHLISGKEVDLVPGDGFREVTAYVLFKCSKERPVSELLDWAKKIRKAVP